MNTHDQKNAVAIAYVRVFNDTFDEVQTEDLGGVTQTTARARRHRCRQSVAICEPISGRLWTAIITSHNDVTMARAASPKIALEMACCDFEASRAEQAVS